MNDPILLYRDDDYVVVHKPAGLLVHRSPIDRRETRFALQLVRDLVGRRVYPVHRLDKPTSGILAFGLSSTAARRLAEAFASGEVEKTYLAVVRGVVPESGLIDHPLVEELDRYGDPLAEPDKGPQAAVTAYPSSRRGGAPLRRRPLPDQPLQPGRGPSGLRPPPPAAPPLQAPAPPDHRRHQVRRGAPQPLLPRTVRLPAPAPRRRRTRLRPPLQRPAAAHRRAPGGDFLALLEAFGWLGTLPAEWRGSGTAR